MDYDLAKKIKELTIPEKILLVEEIWDDIARENEAFELSPSQKNELERRLQSYSENPSQGRKWEEIRAEFLKS
jgi:putative addiction module component (TIGR02574 family)